MKNKILKVEMKKNRRGELLPSGVPFTGIGNWLDLKKKKGQNISEKAVITQNVDIDRFVFKEAVKIIGLTYPETDIKLKNSVSTRDNYEQILKKTKICCKELNILKKPAILITLFRDEFYFVSFIRNKHISEKVFLQILKHFQACYNLVLVGYERSKIMDILSKNKPVYTPTKSYPDHQTCFYTTIAEKIRSEHDIVFYDSLLPAFDLMCLPSYVTMQNLFRTDHASFNNPVLGNDALKSAGISCSIINFKNFKQASRYYEQETKKGKALILKGSPKGFHFMIDHMDAYKNGVKLGNDTMVNFSGSIYENPIVHSTKRYYFGRLTGRDFKKFWSHGSLNQKKKKSLTKGRFCSYNVLELGNKIKKYDVGMLYQALAANISFFYKNPTVIGKRSGEKIFFGRQVIPIFADEVARGIIADITILDMINRLPSPMFFLRDLIADIVLTSKDFQDDLRIVDGIIGQWKCLLEMVLDEATKKNIKYVYLGPVMPTKKTHGLHFITDVCRKEILDMMESISCQQDMLMDSLFGKLNKIGIVIS